MLASLILHSAANFKPEIISLIISILAWPIYAEDPSNSDDVGEAFRDLLKGQSDKTIALAYALCTSLVKEMSKE